MSDWFRVDADHPHHPKFEDAGHWGWSVTVAAWCIACRYGRHDGDITKWWRPSTLAKWCQLGSLDDGTALAKQGMEAAIAAGLIDDDGGVIKIHDWREMQPMTNAERQAAYRRRKSSENYECVTKSNASVTQSNARQTNKTDKQDIQDIHNKTDKEKRVQLSQGGEAILSRWLSISPGISEQAARNALATLEIKRGIPAIEKLSVAIWEDEFWRRNVRSPAKFLRRDKDGALWWDRLWSELIDNPRPRSDGRPSACQVPVKLKVLNESDD